MDGLGDFPSWQCRYPLLAVIGERSEGWLHLLKAVCGLHRTDESAERPTGAGLTLGMGLRDIGGEAGLVMQRRRSPAKPDGLGGVAGLPAVFDVTTAGD